MKDSSCGHLGHQPHPLPHPHPSPPSWGPLGPGRWVWGTRQRHPGWRGWGWGACTALTPEENSWTSEFRSLGAGNLGGVFPHGGSVLRTWKRLCFGCIWLNRAVSQDSRGLFLLFNGAAEQGWSYHGARLCPYSHGAAQASDSARARAWLYLGCPEALDLPAPGVPPSCPLLQQLKEVPFARGHVSAPPWEWGPSDTSRSRQLGACGSGRAEGWSSTGSWVVKP